MAVRRGPAAFGCAHRHHLYQSHRLFSAENFQDPEGTISYSEQRSLGNPLGYSYRRGDDFSRTRKLLHGCAELVRGEVVILVVSLCLNHSKLCFSFASDQMKSLLPFLAACIPLCSNEIDSQVRVEVVLLLRTSKNLSNLLP